jgi:LEA14-like dessication related protein
MIDYKKQLNMKLFYLLIISTLLYSCADFKDVSITKIEEVKLISMSAKSADAEINVKIKNPNNTGFSIYKSQADVNVNGIDIGTAEMMQKIYVKANSEDTYTFKIHSDFSKISATNLTSLMLTAMSKNIKIGIKGEIKAGKLLIQKKFPIDVTQNVPLLNK